MAQPNFKLRGSVGRRLIEDRQVYFDSEDFVQLPINASPLSVLIESSAYSKDMLLITLPDKLGNRLYSFPPLPPGSSIAFSCTLTDDSGAVPYRLQLHVATGAADHTVMYRVLLLRIVHRQLSAMQDLDRRGASANLRHSPP